MLLGALKRTKMYNYSNNNTHKHTLTQKDRQTQRHTQTDKEKPKKSLIHTIFSEGIATKIWPLSTS